MSAALSAVDERHWYLFVDWCLSSGSGVSEITPEALDLFFTEVPLAPSTQSRRARAIRKGLVMSGVVEENQASRSSSVRVGESWSGIPRALAQLPTTRFPVGLRGRRDGWLIVLLGVLGMTRQQALDVGPDDVVLFPDLTVSGVQVPRAESPEECPACAVYRWLRVGGPALLGYRSEARDLLEPALAVDGEHDCWSGLDGQWRQAESLLPAIDRHGWASGDALTLRSVTAIMRCRQMMAQLPEKFVPREARPPRTAEETSAELAAAYDAFDEVDERLAALFARSAEILGDSSDLLDHLRSFDLPLDD